MTEPSDHPYVEWIVREARRPVASDAGARDRIMTMIRVEGAHRPSGAQRLWSRIVEPRVFRRSPIMSGLLAAGLVGIGIVAGGLTNWGVRKDGQPSAGVAMQPPVSHMTDTVVKFVYVGPQASKVSLVGDFNAWDATRTPMVRSANSGLWTVTLPLTAGRHLYAFVVDGTTWTSDPGAPIAPDDGFGHASSVRNVPGPIL
jgi:hypothetical protein